MGCAASRDDADRAVSLPNVNVQHSAAPVSASTPQPSKQLGAPTSPQPQMISSAPAQPQKPKQKPSSRDYFDVDALLDSVESGAIAPLRGSWVVKLHEKGGRLKRRQDLPPEAFWSTADLRKAAQKLGKKFGVLCAFRRALVSLALQRPPRAKRLSPRDRSHRRQALHGAERKTGF